jgi:type IV pilus assembly protein PilW
MQIRGRGGVECWRGGVMDENAKCRSLSVGVKADEPASSMAGFTIIELLIAIALGMVILAGLFRTFKVQHDSYVIQDQVSAMQQNLRAAMHFITRDLQMAGYYTNFDPNTAAINWTNWNGAGSNITGKPLILAVDNASGVGVKTGTDVIVIVKASLDEGRLLGNGESASGDTISLSSWNLDSQPGNDLNEAAKKYGVLVKNDLSNAELFHLDTTGKINPPLKQSYHSDPDIPAHSDRVHRADIIMYKIDSTISTGPCLVRRNLGNDNGDQVIAENIDNLQFRYQLNDGSWVNDPAGVQARVRAVEIFLIARTAYPQRGYIDSTTYAFGSGTTAYNYTPSGEDRKYRRKVLTSLAKTRNIGL